jgi:thiol-disulfide isomerase/thioredoxin
MLRRLLNLASVVCLVSCVALMGLPLLFIAVMAFPAFSQELNPISNDAISYPVLSGVGMALDISDGAAYVFKVMPDSVADKSKVIHKGDQIISVQNGDKIVAVQGMSLGEVVSLIRGPVGSTVTLELRSIQKESNFKVALVREAVPIEGQNLSYQKFVGQQAPTLEFSPLNDSTKIRLSQYRGKVIVLDFWATWCGACYKPVEDLQQIALSHPEWNGRVELLAVSVDSDDTEREAASKTIQAKEWTRTANFSVDPSTLHAAGIQVLPVMMIISPDGTIVTMADAHAIDVGKEVERLLQNAKDSPTDAPLDNHERP